MSSDDGRWFLVVPVKRLAAAKTRLGPPYDLHRADLALAFALDTTAAALACPTVDAVVTVTDDPVAADALRDIGAQVVADEPDAGLNPALTHGAAAAARMWPDRGAGALSADLPGLRPDELTTVLARAAAHDRSFVRDAGGSGTTLVLARSAADLRPSFGPGSADRHASSGMTDLSSIDVMSVRRDVDTAGDLDLAAASGFGQRTTRLLDRLRRASLG